VAWIGAPRGPDEESEIVRAAIVERGINRYGALVADVAERLFARDNACVGGVADVGFFRGWYVGPARRLLDRLDGTLIRVGTSSERRVAER
jgi:hypothetical protein